MQEATESKVKCFKNQSLERFNDQLIASLWTSVPHRWVTHSMLLIIQVIFLISTSSEQRKLPPYLTVPDSQLVKTGVALLRAKGLDYVISGSGKASLNRAWIGDQRATRKN